MSYGRSIIFRKRVTFRLKRSYFLLQLKENISDKKVRTKETLLTFTKEILGLPRNCTLGMKLEFRDLANAIRLCNDANLSLCR